MSAWEAGRCWEAAGAKVEALLPNVGPGVHPGELSQVEGAGENC